MFVLGFLLSFSQHTLLRLVIGFIGVVQCHTKDIANRNCAIDTVLQIEMKIKFIVFYCVVYVVVCCADSSSK